MFKFLKNLFKSKEYILDENGKMVELVEEKDDGSNEKEFEIHFLKSSNHYIVKYKKAKSDNTSFLWKRMSGIVELSTLNIATKFRTKEGAIKLIDLYKEQQFGDTTLVEEI